MNESLRAIETEGIVVDSRHIETSADLPVGHKVRLVVLLPEEEDILEDEWLRAAARSSAFDFLNHPDEEIYTLEDGEPIDFSA